MLSVYSTTVSGEGVSASLMLTSKISTEPVYLSYLSFELMFSQIEFRIDQSSIVIRVDVKNTGKHEENLSCHHFILASELQRISPSASYCSEEKGFGKIWTRKTLKPGQSCTIISKFNADNTCKWYELNYKYRNFIKIIKRFQVD